MLAPPEVPGSGSRQPVQRLPSLSHPALSLFTLLSLYQAQKVSRLLWAAKPRGFLWVLAPRPSRPPVLLPRTDACPSLMLLLVPRSSWEPRRNLRAATARAPLIWKRSKPHRRRALPGQGSTLRYEHLLFPPKSSAWGRWELAVPFANPFLPLAWAALPTLAVGSAMHL